MENVKRVTRMGGYGRHSQVKCVFKALISGTCKKHNNIFPDEISALSVTQFNSHRA